MSQLIQQLIQYIVLVSPHFSTDLGYSTQLQEPWDHNVISIQRRSQKDLDAMYLKPIDSENGFSVGGLQFGFTIFLSRDWSAASVKDQSILLHELVHILQDDNGFEYDCSGDRERLAYLIQEKWLIEEQGWSREQFYEEIVHPFAFMAAISCHPLQLPTSWEYGP